MTLDAEVGVVGLGTMGSMALWQAARRGIPAVGLEQFTIGHQLGAGAGEARQFRPDYLEDEVREVMAGAIDQYRQLEADSGYSLLTLTGGLTIGPGDCELVRTLDRRIRQAGDTPEYLGRAAMSDRFPQHRLDADDVVIWNRHAGFVRPEHAITAALGSARSHGAHIVQHTQVHGVEPDGDAVLLHTAGRTLRVRRAIITAGPWAWELLPRMVPGANLGRLLITWFPTRDPGLFEPARFPTFTRFVEGQLVYGFPSLWQNSVRVGPAGPRETLRAPEDLDRSAIPRDELDSIMGIVDRWLPDLDPTVIRTGTHMDAYTPDGQPIVGHTDDTGAITVAAGFSGRGFKMAPVVGGILVDLAVSGSSDIDLSAWAPDRFRR